MRIGVIGTLTDTQIIVLTADCTIEVLHVELFANVKLEDGLQWNADR